jgi:hypothetical protein
MEKETHDPHEFFYLCLGLAQTLRLSKADRDMQEIGQTSKLNADQSRHQCVT